MFHERRFQLDSAIKTRKASTILSISSDGTTLAVDSDDESLQTLSITDDEIIIKRFEFEPISPNLEMVFALSPDGQYLATYEKEIRQDYHPSEIAIRLHDTSTGSVVHEFDWNVVFPTPDSKPEITRLQFLAGGRHFSALTKRGEVAIWSTANRNLLRFVGQGSLRSHGMVLSHDEHWFISLESNIEYSGLDHPVSSHVGRYFLLLNDLYAYQSRVCYNFERSSSPFWARGRSLPFGVTRLGGIEQVEFGIWNSYSGERIRDLTLHELPNDLDSPWSIPVYSFHLSHNDKLLAGHIDGAINMWNVASGENLTVKRPTTRHLVGFTTDDRFLICHDAHNLYVWDIGKQAWTGTHPIKGKISNITMSDTNRVVATIWNGEHWEIAIIDLSL